ncbi:hypothetical protein BIT28_10240 [Photobacterium proteolyticum]|uniref:Lysozyme inhibitor LprI-like N-terminal domain-containing protein n=1 Tax=Photobacterium proteolyticum TaxID=1903952 RepID=A0A1Q9G6L4_9GAMM|nr:lysozyme inhibitor LprI family protein [Photobacterium proteolyticum]OLQ69922.1 hypothetical protein BIT28_10240 [Photobacterium proteolyticum]
MKSRLNLVLVSILFYSFNVYAIDYEYKSVSDFNHLSSFKNIEDFESSYGDYIQSCLDNTGGGSGGIPCLIASKLWDRELNIYYSKLRKMLSEKEKESLKQSQLTWLEDRDKTLKFNSILMDRVYPPQGTMFQLMHSGDVSDVAVSIIKQRALLLKSWAEAVEIKRYQ